MKMLNNKKLFLLLSILCSISFVNAGVVGVGQVGEKYVYKVNGILVLVSAGDIVDGCVVKAGSGLKCAQKNTNLNNVHALRDLNESLKNIESLLDKNQLLKNKLIEKENEIKSIKTMIGRKIIQKNRQLNKLSDRLNAITQAQ